MTKIVNSLTAKMEIGSPMASLYLLGHPDHYTSHSFTPFYWQSYVYEVSKYWHEEDDTNTEKIALFKKGNRIIGLSPIYDYVYRPKYLETLNLYDFISSCKRERNNQSNETEQYTSDMTNIEIEINKSNLELTIGKTQDNLKSGLYPLLSGHPFSDTHCIRFYSRKKHSIPNFVGATLPRHDQGDREYYCKTMLTLFKPWRTGQHLKQKDETWDDAFNNYQFTAIQTQIIENFNIKYECMDASDDYFAELRSFENEEHSIEEKNSYDEELPEMEGTDGYTEISNKIGKKELTRRAQINSMTSIMTKAHWTSVNANLLIDKLHNPVQPIIDPANWKEEIIKYRREILHSRLQSYAALQKLETTGNKESMNVKIVDKSYLEKKYY
ncbi:hypothetical protein BDN72DRAFT_780923, partial [Pluteus cervinus]